MAVGVNNAGAKWINGVEKFAPRNYCRKIGLSQVMVMNSIADLRRIYEEELGQGPFPTGECASAGITGTLHGNLIVYLADIAGLASRGEQLPLIPEPERGKFRRIASTGLFDKYPQLRSKVSPRSTPKLHALVAATERARLIILEALNDRWR